MGEGPDHRDDAPSRAAAPLAGQDRERPLERRVVGAVAQLQPVPAQAGRRVRPRPLVAQLLEQGRRGRRVLRGPLDVGRLVQEPEGRLGAGPEVQGRRVRERLLAVGDRPGVVGLAADQAELEAGLLPLVTRLRPRDGVLEDGLGTERLAGRVQVIGVLDLPAQPVVRGVERA